MIEASNKDVRVRVDFRSDEGYIMPMAAIVGGNGSGKSLLQMMAMRLFSSTAQKREQIRAFTEDVNGVCEFEVEGRIYSGVVRDGIIVQKPGEQQMQLRDDLLLNGCLFYDASMTLRNLRVGESYAKQMMQMLLEDFYKQKIKDCVVFVDNFDLGLDSNNHRVFAQALIRKALERDNQLIVSCLSRERVNMFPQQSVIDIGDGGCYIERMNNLINERR
jgi:ABC-type dipeptide/oligopeptide/nickel transport system ATPase component